MSDDPSTPISLAVEPSDVGARLDVFLSNRFPAYSRAHLRRVIGQGGVTVDGQPSKAAHRLRAGESVSIRLPRPPSDGPEPEDLPLDILFEDEHLIALNKAPGMVVHPAKGHWSGTLTAGLAYHFRQLSSVGGPTRPGIVHRLDRDTSGVIVIAKTDEAHLGLASQFEARTTEKEYRAIVRGRPDHDRDVIVKSIGRHPYQREKMAIRDGHATSRAAETFYEVIRRYRGWTSVRILPKTGRTHQIRVHLASIGHPILCDRQYGGRAEISRRELTGGGDDSTVLLARHALHAHRLKLRHPLSAEPLDFVAALPDDLRAVLDELEKAAE